MPFPYSPLQSTTPSSLSKEITESTLIATGNGTLVGIIVSFHTSGTIKFWDNTSGATTVLVNTITLATSGTYDRTIPFYGIKFMTGLYITTTGTVDAVVAYNQ